MSTSSDYYAVLQVHPGAEPEVIDAAYKKLAAKYHPDVSRDPQATERMTQINAAYEVLSDPAKRAAYDATRTGAVTARSQPRGRRRRERVVFGESRQVTIAWLPSLVLLAAIILATRLFRLGTGETALILVVATALWLLTRKR